MSALLRSTAISPYGRFAGNPTTRQTSDGNTSPDDEKWGLIGCGMGPFAHRSGLRE
jgi:hypothetical protein